MNLQIEKLDLIEWITRINDATVIDKLRQIKVDYSNSEEWWDRLKKRRTRVHQSRSQGY